MHIRKINIEMIKSVINGDRVAINLIFHTIASIFSNEQLLLFSTISG